MYMMNYSIYVIIIIIIILLFEKDCFTSKPNKSDFSKVMYDVNKYSAYFSKTSKYSDAKNKMKWLDPILYEQIRQSNIKTPNHLDPELLRKILM